MSASLALPKPGSTNGKLPVPLNRTSLFAAGGGDIDSYAFLQHKATAYSQYNCNDNCRNKDVSLSYKPFLLRNIRGFPILYPQHHRLWLMVAPAHTIVLQESVCPVSDMQVRPESIPFNHTGRLGKFCALRRLNEHCWLVYLLLFVGLRSLWVGFCSVHARLKARVANSLQ